MHSTPSTRKPAAKAKTDWEPLQAFGIGLAAFIVVIAIVAGIIGFLALLVMWLVPVLTAGAFAITFMQSLAGVLLISILGGMIGRQR